MLVGNKEMIQNPRLSFDVLDLIKATNGLNFLAQFIFFNFFFRFIKICRVYALHFVVLQCTSVNRMVLEIPC